MVKVTPIIHVLFISIIIFSLVVIGLTLSQITNKYKEVTINNNIVIDQYITDLFCSEAEAVPFTQVTIFKDIFTGEEEYGKLECGWRLNSSVLRFIVHFFSVLTCIICVILLKKQKLNLFLGTSYLMMIVGLVGIYSSIMDVISVKRAYNYCMNMNDLPYDCQYKAFNSTVIINFICSMTIFICAIVCGKCRDSLFASYFNANNENRDREREIEDNHNNKNNSEPVPKIIKLKPQKQQNDNNSGIISNESILSEESINFENNNGTILTTNDQYLTSNDDRDL